MIRLGNFVIKHPKAIVITAIVIIGFGVNGALNYW